MSIQSTGSEIKATAALTARQLAVFEFVVAHQLQEGMPPTRVDIARHFGFRSPNAAEEHLRALARKGVLGIAAGTARGLRVLTPQSLLANPMEAAGESSGESVARSSAPRNDLSLVGKVAAGTPLLAVENVERTLPIDGAVFHPHADYLLRVSGTSMRNAGIFDGDLLAVKRSSTAENGEIVVVRIGDEVTVKRLLRKDSEVWLLAENPEFAPTLLDPNRLDIAIEGRAVGVIRPFPPNALRR